VRLHVNGEAVHPAKARVSHSLPKERQGSWQKVPEKVRAPLRRRSPPLSRLRAGPSWARCSSGSGLPTPRLGGFRRPCRAPASTSPMGPAQREPMRVHPAEPPPSPRVVERHSAGGASPRSCRRLLRSLGLPGVEDNAAAGGAHETGRRRRYVCRLSCCTVHGMVPLLAPALVHRPGLPDLVPRRPSPVLRRLPRAAARVPRCARCRRGRWLCRLPCGTGAPRTGRLGSRQHARVSRVSRLPGAPHPEPAADDLERARGVAVRRGRLQLLPRTHHRGASRSHDGGGP